MKPTEAQCLRIKCEWCRKGRVIKESSVGEYEYRRVKDFLDLGYQICHKCMDEVLIKEVQDGEKGYIRGGHVLRRLYGRLPGTESVVMGIHGKRETDKLLDDIYGDINDGALDAVKTILEKYPNYINRKYRGDCSLIEMAKWYESLYNKHGKAPLGSRYNPEMVKFLEEFHASYNKTE